MGFSKFYALDAATGLLKRDIGLAALTADAYVGTQWDQGAAAATDCIAAINIESCKVSAGDETYLLTILGSQTSDRSDGEILAQVFVGDAGTIALETRDTIAGDRVEMRFRTEKNGTQFQYVDLHLDVSGTFPSIGFNAYITKEF